MATKVGSCQFLDPLMKQLQDVIHSVHDNIDAIDIRINDCLHLIETPPAITIPQFHLATDFHYQPSRPDSHSNTKCLICTQLSHLLMYTQLYHLQHLISFMGNKLMPVGQTYQPARSSFHGNTSKSEIPSPLHQTPAHHFTNFPLQVTDDSYPVTSVTTNQPTHHNQPTKQTDLQSPPTTSTSCSCTAKMMKDIYLFSTAVCNDLKRIQNQCNNLQKALVRAFTYAELCQTNQPSNLKQYKHTFRQNFNNISTLGQQGIDICSSIQVITSPDIPPYKTSEIDQHQQRPNSSTSVHQSTDIISPTQDLEYSPQIHPPPTSIESRCNSSSTFYPTVSTPNPDGTPEKPVKCVLHVPHCGSAKDTMQQKVAIKSVREMVRAIEENCRK